MKLTTEAVLARITAAPTRYREMASTSKPERAKLRKIIDDLLARGAIRQVYINRFPYYVLAAWAPTDSEMLADIEGRCRSTIDGCLLWSEYVDPHRGPVWCHSPRGHKDSVRRAVWELRGGGKLTFRDSIKTTCDREDCVAYGHLRKTSRSEPLAARQKTPVHAMRIAQAARAGAKKLTLEKVRAIRASTDSAAVLALRYGVAKQTVTAIRRNEIWKETPAGMFTGLIARQAA